MNLLVIVNWDPCFLIKKVYESPLLFPLLLAAEREFHNGKYCSQALWQRSENFPGANFASNCPQNTNGKRSQKCGRFWTFIFFIIILFSKAKLIISLHIKQSALKWNIFLKIVFLYGFDNLTQMRRFVFVTLLIWFNVLM